MKKFVIIVAGGNGSRMKNTSPKQFLELKGRPILMHTIAAFRGAIPEINIILVLLSAYREEWERLCKKNNFNSPEIIVDGGETRFHSVKNGLEKVPDNCIVGVHDAARPLVNADTILKTFEAAEIKGNASPVVPLTDSVRIVEKEHNRAIDRSSLFIVQTPQCFHSNSFKSAFQQEYNPSFTDDASVVESMGETINLVEGNVENIKITNPKDLLIAEALLKVP